MRALTFKLRAAAACWEVQADACHIAIDGLDSWRTWGPECGQSRLNVGPGERGFVSRGAQLYNYFAAITLPGPMLQVLSHDQFSGRQKNFAVQLDAPGAIVHPMALCSVPCPPHAVEFVS